MSNKTDLDWLARNVHVWPAGDHQPWCYVYMVAGGAMKASGNFLDAVAYPTMVTKDQWLSRRAELQNKPRWEDAPEWAEFLGQDEDGEWKWIAGLPGKYVDGWTAVKIKVCCKGIALGDWRDTLEKRPEQAEFEPFVSIEDSQEKEMKQDNKWFERGELPPVGEVCEWLECSQTGWQTVTVAGYYLNAAWLVPKGKEPITVYNPTGFRPLRTERDKAIDEMVCEFIDHYGDPKGGEHYIRIATKLYDAGYRKGVK